MSETTQTEPKQHNIEELNKLYTDADQADQDIFAEQRSNVLLISGEHYTKRNAKYWNRIKDSKDISSEQKLRLTKNHIQKITKTYVNNIVSHAPSVKVVPQNEKENQDQKSAQLNDSVWQYGRYKQNMKMKTSQLAKDYIDLGEVAVKVFWNPSAGKFLGYRAETDEGGNPVMDESGQMVSSKTPAFSGDLQIERLYAFNLLRHPSAKSMEESPVLIIRKMVPVKELEAMVDGDEDKLKMIQEQKDDTFLVFDGNHQNYQKSEGQAMLKEFYFKPCVDYPLGYFYLAVDGGILFEGELPFGIYPIIYEGFDEIQTSPRHRSIVKQLRPYQAELNRAASKIAEHQVTLGDDKILVQSGTKVTTGVHLPGVRSIQYSGMAPTILQGRAGDQYFTYMQSQIKEMYQVANIDEDSALKDKNSDPFGQLFQSVHDKKKFTVYTDKFEGFLCQLCRTYLDLARHYFPEDMLIPMVGRSEAINIAEFKTTTELCYSIKAEAQSDDITTMMGRQLTINHALQYVGNQMSKEDIGKLMRAMPFGNFDESFSDMTLNYDSATNMILALDRGSQPMPNKYDDSTYMIGRLVARSRMSDFPMLSPQIQQNYAQLISMYEDQETQKQQELLRAQAQFIPSGGARIKVDYYVPDPQNPERPIRATLPAESVDWLIKRLADQGSSQEIMTSMNQGAVGEIAGKLNQQQGAVMPAQGMPSQGPPMNSPQGPPMPTPVMSGRRMQ
jgi:hypothetical protein